MIHVISLGAGVQSSTMALMAAHGEIGPMPDTAIFADTQGEPAEVYRWLDWIEKKLPFPVHRVSAGNLMLDNLIVRRSSRSGLLYQKTSVPFFIRKEDGRKGIVLRKCTRDFKITPLTRKVNALRAGASATVWIGISTDEAHRMKPNKEKWATTRWPLIEVGMSRTDCLTWMAAKGYPRPPRSACTFCPYHSNEEWARLKRDAPSEFAEVVEFERAAQGAQKAQEALRGVPFLHPSLQPLDQIDFEANAKRFTHGGDEVVSPQLSLWGEECEGMCGV